VPKRKRITNMATMIVVLAVLCIFGGGWGYSRWRR
jgi:hypothetical protein